MLGGSILKKPFAIVILDGWGLAPAWGGNAITQAKTRNFNNLWQSYPSTTLLASGQSVGLPVNAPGNSEAGHLNIGAGNIVHQDITLIDAKIEDKSFYQNKVILDAIEHAAKYRSKIHLMGLLSKTGTHSHIRHLFVLLKLLKSKGVTNTYIHFFSDGRDSDPLSGIEMIDEVETKIAEIGLGTIESVTGRFFAMDRDNRWGRIARAYNLLVKGEGNTFDSPKSAFAKAYSMGQTDEFIEPRTIVNKTQHFIPIADNDSVIFFNFRSDRSRELTQAFLDEAIPEFPDRKKLSNLYFASFVIYDQNMQAKKVFTPEKISEPLAKVWANQGLRQLHIAETEKYAHVTYFFNGGEEKPFPGEKRLMIPSKKNVPTYDRVPQMSAGEITSVLVGSIQKNSSDLYVVNFANADMVGHTGNLNAAIQAVEYVDECLGRVVEAILNKSGMLFVMADHGNAEQMINPSTGYQDTEHTTNPVPFIMVSNDLKLKSVKLISNGVLANAAPTALEIFGIKQPISMINHSLIIKENASYDQKE